MACDSHCFNILLVDDDVAELDIVKRILSALTDAPVCVDHVTKCSAAVALLNSHNYDLVLLDNRLSDQISAEFSAPFIKAAFSSAEIAIISSDIDVPYLQDPNRLRVDHIVDKANMIGFLRDQLEQKVEIRLHPVKTYSRRAAR